MNAGARRINGDPLSVDSWPLRGWRWVEHRRWMQGIALLLSGALVYSSVAPSFAQVTLWEERRQARTYHQSLPADPFPLSRGLPPTLAALSPEFLGMAIPSTACSVVESHWVDVHSPTVIYLQDAHGVVEAQRHTAEILRALETSQKPLRV
ncbi:MAG: hypothetical protein HYZ73_03370, partial [Elusimicrobia bacterium]|nr:hypothetical protein [Elusimicrobiota bacterium]